MQFYKIVSEGIAHNSYMIASGGSAAVIDPRRDSDCYLEIARKNDCTITHIFETHRNEDYVIGSTELASRCGAEIYHGARMAFGYGMGVHEGDRFALGSLDLTVIETPGHTEESCSFVLRDREISDEPYMVFCGDTLFAGDIARTDFFGNERKREMAERMYDSITTKILPLGDGVILCPAHGAGSICGAEIADHPFSTIGYERRTNPLLRIVKEAFVSRRITETPYTPPYFRQMERFNKDGAPLRTGMPRLHPLTVAELNPLRISGCQVVDIRAPTGFAGGHIPGSFSIWRDGVPAFTGWFLNYEEPIVLIDDFNLDLEPVLRHFVRLGYDNLSGYLAGGFAAWYRAAQEVSTIATCTVQCLRQRIDAAPPFLLDVRDKKNHTRVGSIPGSYHVYVGELPYHLDEIPRDTPVVVYCDAGFKGSLAASVLARHQYTDVTNVLGGMQAWMRAGYPVEK
ncbi:MAG: MBL fold metallo-hydrolase [Methanoregula sp.]|nr:MBL fold metallo-hydrolase [Methanoregula sp.]MDD5187340.1 MBL fold metallo-hydrolase [Methanoregula sp.]